MLKKQGPPAPIDDGSVMWKNVAVFGFLLLLSDLIPATAPIDNSAIVPTAERYCLWYGIESTNRLINKVEHTGTTCYMYIASPFYL